MRARLGERLRFEFDIDAACLDRSLPSGILLTLVENAVEHGIAPMLQGGCVRVRARCDGAALDLQVQDDGAGLAADAPAGLGLSNCRERLRHRYGDRAALTLTEVPPGCVAHLRLACA
jgi:LytS/YehU family sensor histidine kinase